MAFVQVQHSQPPDWVTSLDAVLAGSSPDTPDEVVTCGEPVLGPASVITPHTGRMDKPQDGPTDFAIQPWTSSEPPPSTASEIFETRSARSSSTTSRNTNRLSLTLPIAPPNSMPSRPTPSSSVPPTPVESIGSGLHSPIDPNEFIIAIAAQERRVLELREMLKQAEDELKGLKNKWNASEPHKMRTLARKTEALRDMASVVDGEDSPAVRRSFDLDRKKMLLSQGTPREYRRKVLRGGHTRTLSLLSPTKPSHDFPVHEDLDCPPSPEVSFKCLPSPDLSRLSKHATWAPRQSPPPHAVTQIAQDFKQGLWTFVEDLRQATVGDEGISATSNRTSDFRLNRANTDQDTIRASSANRGRIPFDRNSEVIDDSPSKASSGSFHDRTQRRRSSSRHDSKARKHFSWTPLTFDDVGDDDWSNWDSPANVKTSRWSGSTVNGDIIPAIPEGFDENEGTLKRMHSTSDLRPSSPQTPVKLGELPSALLNSASNIKRMSTDFIKEWEKSLSPPPETEDFETSFHQRIKNKAP